MNHREDASRQPPRTFQIRPHALALTTAVIWSLSYVNLKFLTESLDPVALVGLRFDFFAIALIPLWLIRRPTLRLFTRSDWTLIVMLGLIGGPIYHLLLTAGAANPGANASLIGLIIATVPIYAALLAWIFLRERPTSRQFIALILGLGGVTVVIVERTGGLTAATDLLGPALILLAAVVGGANTVLMRAGRTVAHPLDLIIVSGTCGVIVMMAVQWIGEPAAFLDLSFRGWAAGAYLGIIAIGLAYVTWCAALRDLTATNVAMYLFVTNCLSAMWAWTFHSDHLGWGFLGGSTLVLIGLILAAMPRRRTPTGPETAEARDGSPDQ